MRNDFAVFVISHGRPNSSTMEALSLSYSGSVFIIVDDEDDCYEQYLANYGDKVIQFNKQEYIHRTDTGTVDEMKRHSSAVYARNFVEQLAIDMQLSYFAIMDDDFSHFRFRFDNEGKVGSKIFGKEDFDKVFEYYREFMETHDDFMWLGMFGNFHFSAGVSVFYDDSVSTKGRSRGFGIFFRKVSTPIEWKSFINEDTIATLSYAKRGKLGFLLPFATFVDPRMGSNEGGNSYYDTDSSFSRTYYAMMMCPDVVKPIYNRGKIIISTKYNNCFPKIISSRYKK